MYFVYVCVFQTRKENITDNKLIHVSKQIMRV